MSRHRRLASKTTLLLAVALGLGAGCSSVTHNQERFGAGPRMIDGEGRHVVESFDVLEAKLAVFRNERAQRLALATPTISDCEELYALMQGICEVKDKLCTIADDHKGMPHYGQLCAEARTECTDAQTSCEDCMGQLPPDASYEPDPEQ